MKTFKVGLCLHGVEIEAETEDEALEVFLQSYARHQITDGNFYPSVELVKKSDK